MSKRVVVAALFALSIAGAGWAQQGQAAPAQEAAGGPVAKQPRPKSQAEVTALQAIFSAPDVDGKIKAGDEFLVKFADSEFKPVILMIMTTLYQQKNDYEKMVIYGERALEADPQSYSVMLMLGQALAQRTREFDLDREEKLGRAEKYAKDGATISQNAPKPRPDITDEQWAAAKKDFVAQSHEILGLCGMARKKYDVAVAEFKTASETAATPDPTVLVRLGAAYNLLGKYDDAIGVLDKVMSGADVHPQIKQFAQAERARAFQAKQGANKPAAAPAAAAPAPAPAPAEAKKP